MCKSKSHRSGNSTTWKLGRLYSRKWRNVVWASVAAAGLGLGTAKANAAESLWISAPNWSYSAAYAATSSNFAYFWGLSVGAGTFSFAGAYASDAFGSAAALAVASAGNGGYGAVDAVGFADPYAGIGIDTPLLNPSLPGSYPGSKPGTDPISGSYTVSDTGITFSSESSSELNGADGLQAFLYTGGTDQTSLDALLGATGTSGNTSAGDISSITALEGLSSLTALDPVVSDPSSNTGITFTNAITNSEQADVILVGFEDAASTPVPSALSLSLLGILGLGGLAIIKRTRRALRA